MWRQTPVRDLEVETPLLPALLGAHHCGTLPTLLLCPAAPAKGNKLSSFRSLVHLQHEVASDLPVFLTIPKISPFCWSPFPLPSSCGGWGEQLWV